jgi:hypothetical protein
METFRCTLSDIRLLDVVHPDVRVRLVRHRIGW